MANDTASSNGYYDNTMFPSPYMPYKYTNTYDTSTKIANECVRINTYSIGEKVTEGMIGNAKRSPSKAALPWQSVTESPCQESFALQKESSNTELKWETFVNDKIECTISSGRRVGAATVTEQLNTHLQQSQEGRFISETLDIST